VSSFQSNHLPDRYSIRLATEQDFERILNFSCPQPNYYLLSLLIALLLLGWWQIHLSTGNLKMLYIISTGSIFVLTLLNLYFIKFRKNLEVTSYITYIVEHGNIICGVVSYLDFENFAYIASVRMGINHRKKGIGSFMIQYCLDTIDKPIYLKCFFKLKDFYARLGFVNIRRSYIPFELRKFRDFNMHWMIFDEIQY
jgi:N-acetylglutamate synthase-like GNAT family acetyltransferase